MAFLGASGRTMVGAAAGAALLSAFGPDSMDAGDKLSAGAVFGGAIGLASPAFRGIAWSGAKTTAASTASHFAAMPGRFSAFRKAGMGSAEAAFHAFGSFRGLGLAGAAAGFAMGGPKGAVIGAGIGMAARPAVGLAMGYSKLAKYPFARSAAITALSFGVLAAGIASRGPEASTEAGLDPYTSETTYDGSGVRDRMSAVGASGDVVLGMHRGRHG